GDATLPDRLAERDPAPRALRRRGAPGPALEGRLGPGRAPPRGLPDDAAPGGARRGDAAAADAAGGVRIRQPRHEPGRDRRARTGPRVRRGGGEGAPAPPPHPPLSRPP